MSTAYTNIDDPSKYFQIALWTGNTSAPRSITNDGNSNLKPDIVWAKNRTTAGTDHELYNSNMGTGTDANLQPSSTAVQGTGTTYGQLTSFDTDGFTVNAGGTNDDKFNENGSEFVAWQWAANGGTTVTNNDGAVTSTVQANQTAGISVLTYTMNSNSNETVGHGLGVAPDVVITKARERGDSNGFWALYTTKYDSSLDYLKINNTDAKSNSSLGAPTSTVFTGAGSSNATYRSFFAFCFAQKQGYSRFNFYRGNGQANGPVVHTGFRPRFVMMREIGSSGSGNSWWVFDRARDPVNTAEKRLAWNAGSEEKTGSFTNVIDFLSNGFKLRNSDSAWNRSGGDYFYMAFAEHPFVTSGGAPTTAV